jgi:CzcA family heavy metal efflux pump
MKSFVQWCLQQRWVVVGLAVLFVAIAGRAVRDARFDAFPEFAPPRVEIQTEAPGLSSEEVEALVTTPLEAALAGTPGVTAVRSRSVLGLSSVLLLFPTGTDLLQARALVQERVTRAAPSLPTVARAPVLLSPLSSTSRILKVGMWSESLSQTALSDLARWRVRPALMSVPGVANVAVWGERRRRVEVRADPDRLVANGVDLSRLVAAAREALSPRAGGLVDLPTTRLPVVQTAMVRSAEELARVPLPTVGRGTVTIGDVAEVHESYAVPIGDALVTRGSGVLLIVEKQPGASTLDVTGGVDAALQRLRPGLTGVEVDPTIFRPASFIERALKNLGHAMGIGCLFVIVVLALFLWNARTALISVLAIPLSLLAAAATLTWLGRTIDTMVIAGLVIALGEVVDDAIIDVENIHRRLRALETPPDLRTAMRVVLEASLEVRSAIVFASMIVLLVFVPILFLDGVAGEFFRPLAFAYALAIVASTVTALTITPVLSLLLLRNTRAHAGTPEQPSPIARALLRVYEPVLRRTIGHPKRLIAGTVVLLAIAVAIGSSLREEFLPRFAENDFLMHWVARPGTSLDAVARSANLARAELLTVPGVRNFGAHIGRAEVADEVVGPNFAELWISVDPQANLEATSARVRAVVDGYPGVFRDVQTYLQERMREVLSGGGGAVVVRLRGEQISAMRTAATGLAHELESVPGIAHARPEAQVLVPQIQIRVDPSRCAALGVEPGLVRARAATLLAGDTVGQFVRGLQPIDVVVWGNNASRHDVAAVRDLGIAVDGRVIVRLGDVADVWTVPVPNTIAHDATTRKLDVLIDLAPGADLSSVSAAVAMRVRALRLPPGHHAEILGEGAARRAASARLFTVAALAIAGIFFVLLADFRSARLALMVFAGLPFALVGGVFAAAHSGVISLGTLIGLVAVIGIAARNGIMLVSHFRHLERDEAIPFGPALVFRGASERLAPILMTALATGLALVPVVVGGQTAGHEIEHPMAVVILGGLVSSTVLTLLVTPALYLWLGGGRRDDDAAED